MLALCLWQPCVFCEHDKGFRLLCDVTRARRVLSLKLPSYVSFHLFD